jgi:hypothetical protein
MRFLSLFLLSLLCIPVALGQTRPVWRLKGEFGFQDRKERIMLHRYLERENRLWLLGSESLLLLDVGNAKVLESRPSTLPALAVSANCSFDDWVFSPDGRKILIIEKVKEKDKKKDKAKDKAKDVVKQNVSVWDSLTEERIAVLDRGQERINVGAWSKNGKTLVTYDYDFNFLVNAPTKLGVSFWDGETFEYRYSISVDFPTWTHLTDDGRRFFAASGRRKSFFGVKYVSDSRGVINVWDTSREQIEKTISVSDPDFNIRTSKVSVSPDGRFFVFVNKHKSKSAEHRLLAWEMNGSITPKYEFKANPKIDDSYVRFSPNGKYFALDAGKNLQIYETQTGEKRFELQNVEPPDFWLNDNQTLINDSFKKMAAFDLSQGRKLYEQKLIYHTVDVSTGTSSTDSSGNITYDTKTVVLDTTRLVAHPSGKMFLTYSNQYVKVFDSRTGELLQTVVSPDLAAPTPDFCQKFPKQCKGDLVWKAGWSQDGKTIYVFNANRQSVTLWEMLEN